MKTSHVFACFHITAIAHLFGQGGALTPPSGVPTPTMKSLDLIEPRTPLVSGANGVTVAPNGSMTISQAGSYYLTKNLEISSNSIGITINASGVYLDLMGHSLTYTGTGAAGSGIFINGSNVRIENGHILSKTTENAGSFSGLGFTNGISCSSAFHNIHLKQISITGTSQAGIILQGDSHLIESCSTYLTGTFGIYATNAAVSHCTTTLSGNTGITALLVNHCKSTRAYKTAISATKVAHSFGSTIGVSSSDFGISAIDTVSSTGESLNGTGIYSANTATHCKGTSQSTLVSGSGISTTNNGIVTDSNGSTQGGDGIVSTTIINSTGLSNGPHGLDSCGLSAKKIEGSKGINTNAQGGCGIFAEESVINSTGTSNAMHGIYSQGSVNQSFGDSSGNQGTNSHGIRAGQLVTNSQGFSKSSGGGSGIFAQHISASFGSAATGALHGLQATVVTHSTGTRTSTEASRAGILATRAVGSYATNGEIIVQKYDMP